MEWLLRIIRMSGMHWYNSHYRKIKLGLRAQWEKRINHQRKSNKALYREDGLLVGILNHQLIKQTWNYWVNTLVEVKTKTTNTIRSQDKTGDMWQMRHFFLEYAIAIYHPCIIQQRKNKKAIVIYDNRTISNNLLICGKIW